MDDKERLEEIKKHRNEADNSTDEYEFEKINFYNLHVDWLIKQAERVQELEEELYGNDIQMGYKRMYGVCNRDYAKLLQQNKRYREAIENIINLWKNATESTDDRELTSLMYKEAIKALEGEE